MIITQEEWHHIYLFIPTFAEQSTFSFLFSLFSLISSLEKSLCCEERSVKREAYKKKKPLMRLFFLEQVRGVEPPYSAWEADVLPMNYTCVPI